MVGLLDMLGAVLFHDNRMMDAIRPVIKSRRKAEAPSAKPKCRAKVKAARAQRRKQRDR